MKKHPTEMVEVIIVDDRNRRFVGPRELVKPILRLLTDRGFSPIDEKKSIPWKTPWKADIKRYGEPSLVLRGMRLRAGLTQKALAQKMGIAPYNLSKMENGSRPISRKMAAKLAGVLRTDRRVFL